MITNEITKCMVVVVIAAMLLTGCKDLKDSFKPGSFGQTKEEQAMVDALTNKHGDLTLDGPPRFLEAFLTTHVENFIPVDVVSKYAKQTEKLYLWFVYDNFHEEELAIQWVYLDQDYSIHTLTSQTGKDFGRGIFILEEPDAGWPTGNYLVSIRGGGLEERIFFEIIDGATVAEAITFQGEQLVLPGSSRGWQLVRVDEFINPLDLSIQGTPTGSRMTGSNTILLDHLRHQGGQNNFQFNIDRTDDKGKTLHAGLFTLTWEDPKAFLPAGEPASFSVSRSYEGWGIAQMGVTFDLGHLEPGYGTSSQLYFQTEEGTRHFLDYDGLLTTEKPLPEGKEPGEEYAILLTIGNGYGYRYVYQWRE